MTTATGRASTIAAPDSDWRDDAACLYVDPDLHFPKAPTPGWRAQLDEAKRVCRGCPAREACLEWALNTGEKDGVWGGLSARQRKELRRPRPTALERCLSRQAWIEKQLELGRTQKALARQLHVNPDVMYKAVRQFNEVREQASAGQGVAA